MGYSAEMISNDGDLILSGDRLPAVIAALHVAEDVLGDHISWCQALSDYDQSDPASFVADVFADYGFPDATAYNGDVHLEYWGGEKVGSCYDEMMRAVAAGVTQRVETMWRGEDGDMWAIVFDGEGSLREGAVTISVSY